MQNEYLNEQSKWEKIESDQKIDVEIMRHYQEKRIVSKQELGKLWDVNVKTIQRYVKDGMPTCSELSKRLFQVFYLEECEEWKNNNINKSQSTKANKKKSTDSEADIENETDNSNDSSDSNSDIAKNVEDIKGKIEQANRLLQLETTTYESADRIKKVLDGLMTAVSLGTKTKDLIPKKDTERAIISIIATLISGLMRDAKILPKECENRSELEIREIMESNSRATIANYKKIAKTNLLSDNTVFDILEKAVSLLVRSIPVDRIIKALEDIK